MASGAKATVRAATAPATGRRDEDRKDRQENGRKRDSKYFSFFSVSPVDLFDKGLPHEAPQSARLSLPDRKIPPRAVTRLERQVETDRARIGEAPGGYGCPRCLRQALPADATRRSNRYPRPSALKMLNSFEHDSSFARHAIADLTIPDRRTSRRDARILDQRARAEVTDPQAAEQWLPRLDA